MSEEPKDPSRLDFGVHHGGNGSAPEWRPEFEPAPEPEPVVEAAVVETAAATTAAAPAPVPLLEVPVSAPPAIASPSGGPPNGRASTSSYVAPEPPPHDKELGLFDHLMELRARIIRCIVYMVIGTTITWCFGQQIEDYFARPINYALAHYGPHGSALITIDPTEGFMAYFQLSFIFGLIFTAPFVLYEMWAFIEPALTRKERRYTLVLLPFSILLFVLGCIFGYAMAPMFFKFLLGYQPKGAPALYGVQKTVVFLGRVILMFGACFQVPVIVIFLNKIGLVSRNWLVDYWRHVVVVIFSVVSIVTPTWDPLTLIVCSIPPCLLYVLSLWIIKWLP